MEKERKITAPEGCKIEKVELFDGVAVVTFREKERQLPKSWEEFCEKFSIEGDECFITNDSIIEERACLDYLRYDDSDRNLLPDHATAEAVLALCQLIQLRNCYNGDWVPDWKNGETKFMIIIYKGEIDVDCANNLSSSILYFKSEQLRDEFLRNFRDLIEKLKPLYGIKEGGEE